MHPWGHGRTGFRRHARQVVSAAGTVTTSTTATTPIKQQHDMQQQSEICMLSTKFRPRRQRNRSTKASFHCSTRGKELDVFFADSIDAQCVCYFVLIHLYRNIRPRVQQTVIRQLDAAAANASETETYAALAAAGRTESLLQTKHAYERPWRPFWHMARLWTRPGYEL